MEGNVRRKAKVDANQAEVVEALRSLGASVYITSGVGSGFPDIVVGFRGQNYLFEIKDENQPPSAKKLTEHEVMFAKDWRGQVNTIENVYEALKVMGAL